MTFWQKKFNEEIHSLSDLSEVPDRLSPQEMDSLKQNILQSISGCKPNELGSSLRTKFSLLINYIIAALLGLCLVGGTAFASTNSLPGSLLYPVKITAEKIQLNLATSELARANLLAKFARERIHELKQLTVKSFPGDLKPGVVNPPPANIFVSKPDAATQTTSTVVAIKPKPDTGRDDIVKLTSQTRQTATDQVNKALNALSRVQDSLQAKGDMEAAGNVAKNISTLQTEAKSNNLDILNSGQPQEINKLPSQQNNDVKHEDGKPPATTSPGSQVPTFSSPSSQDNREKAPNTPPPATFLSNTSTSDRYPAPTTSDAQVGSGSVIKENTDQNYRNSTSSDYQLKSDAQPPANATSSSDTASSSPSHSTEGDK